MQMPGRSNSYGAGVSYRYAYNGMELDNEVSGNGNSYTTEFRQYDPRLGRWKSLDPLMAKFPWMSPYVAFDNNPVFYVDPLGLASEGGPGDGDKTKQKNSKTDKGGDKPTFCSTCGGQKPPSHIEKFKYKEGNNGFNEPGTFVDNLIVSTYNSFASMIDFADNVASKENTADALNHVGEATVQSIKKTGSEVDKFVDNPQKYISEVTVDDLENGLGNVAGALILRSLIDGSKPKTKFSNYKPPSFKISEKLSFYSRKDGKFKNGQGRQARHIKGHPEFERKLGASYFETVREAQAVMRAYNTGAYKLIEVTNSNTIIVRVKYVNGYFHNEAMIKAGKAPEITHYFELTGTESVKITPLNPRKFE
jgi:RHS repeat-associated protein